MSQHIRIVTYNIRKGKGASGRAKNRAAELGEAIRCHHPDVVACQEVSHSYASSMSQSDELGRILQMPSYYRPNKQRRGGHHGNATFTSFEVVAAQNYDISTNPIERRGALYLRMQVGGRTLHVLNAHLGLHQAERTSQAHRLGAIVAEHAEAHDPVVLAGDFNDWNNRLDAILTREYGFRDAFASLPRREVRTWHARRPLFTLDHVYVRNLEAASARCLDGDPWDSLSDHLPLIAELELTSRAAAA